jgi:hypothetical protein
MKPLNALLIRISAHVSQSPAPVRPAASS